jgi:hypothetical protein
MWSSIAVVLVNMVTIDVVAGHGQGGYASLEFLDMSLKASKICMKYTLQIKASSENTGYRGVPLETTSRKSSILMCICITYHQVAPLWWEGYDC